MNITKQKQTHRYRRQASSCRWGKVGETSGTRQGGTNIMYKINKLRICCTAQEYNQYFATLNGV